MYYCQLIQIETNASKPSSVLSIATTDNVSVGQTYIYRVRSKFGDIYTNYSDERSINANITPIEGWAWIGSGLGWIRLSNSSVNSSWGPANQVIDSQLYSVYVDNTGKLSGYAWSPYAGWLSFNEGDLVGCPLAPCEAKVDNDGFVSGWAKFIRNSQGVGLDRFVSLSKNSLDTQCGNDCDYGLYYTTTTRATAQGNITVGELRGFAWGGDGFGWITFGGPILKKVEDIGVDPNNPTKRQVKLIWDNPVEYSEVQIWRKKLGEIFYSIATFNENNQPEKIGQGKNKEYIDTGLEPNTVYQYYLRGRLQ